MSTSVVRRCGRALLLACSVAAVPLLQVRAQTSTGSIRGFVLNEAGAPLAGATITARNTDLGARRGATTGDNGFYSLAGLTPGPYELAVRRIGSAPQTRVVRVGVGQVLTIDFRLADTALALGPVVVSATPAVEMRTTEVATNISQEQIQNLPQNNRNFLDFALLAPGVQRRGAGLSSGGASVSNSNLMVDGASYKSDVLPGGIAGQDPSLARTVRGVGQVLGNPFPQNAVQEFRVITENYKAEYQKATGAMIVASTRSGTNETHGDFFYSGQNKGMLAMNYWDLKDKIEKPAYMRSQFGGSIGGPIVRDRAHYFLSYEGNFQNFDSRVVFRPDAGLPALPDSVLAGQGNYPIPLRSNLFFGKLDYTLSDRQSLIFTANVRHDRDQRDFGGGAAVDQKNTIGNDVNTFLLRHTFAAQPFTNEAQVSYQRFRWQQVPDQFGTPRVEYPQYGITRGGNVSFQDFIQDRVSLRNDLTYNASSHVVKGGVNVDFLRYDITKRLEDNPVFRFRTDQACGLNCPFEATLQVGDPNLKTTNQQFGAYLQDDWAVTPRFTMNLGVRWDFETDQLNNSFVTPRNVRDSVTAFLAQYPFFDAAKYFTDGKQRPRFYGAFQPRVGFSYDVSGTSRTVVFGGGGLFYDRNNYNAILDEKYRFQRPRYTFHFAPTANPANGVIAWNPSYFSREGLVGLVASGQSNSPEVYLLENDTRPPRSVQASLGVRHTVGAYQFSVTGTQVNTYNLLRYTFGNRNPADNNNTVWNQHGIGAIVLSTDEGRAWYKALLFRVSKPLAEGTRWGGDIAYTLAKTETNTYNDVDDAFALDYVTPAEFARVPGRFDERHRVVTNLIARLPFGFLGSTVVTLGSGVPYTLSTNCDNPADHTNDAFCQGQPIGNGNFHDWDDNPAGKGPRSERVSGKWFGPFGKWAYRNVDLRLQKDLGFGQQRVSLMVDVYNVFNFTNFNYDNFQYNLRWDGTQDPPRERIPFVTYDSRRMQLGARYTF